ncbi:MAG: hypothetical protein K2H41_14965 [Acetatifactor sp.]|nr:hypothetical protein [Acetatifactor sp.]
MQHGVRGQQEAQPEDISRRFLDDIEEADMVLVGLGEEFDVESSLRQMAGYEQGKKLLLASERSALLPAWQKLFRREASKSVAAQLCVLAGLLEKKNYFVVSVAVNDEIADIPWRSGRLVMPCGSDLKVQCDGGCERNLRGAESEEQERLLGRLQEWREAILQGEGGADPEGLGICPVCGKPLEFNNVYSARYDENGYLPDWQNYMKWLQGTLNRKLVVLELGAGMQFPSVIRFPFEKAAYFNQQAKFYRVHEKVYQITEELGAKGVGIAKNAIDWLQNLC